MESPEPTPHHPATGAAGSMPWMNTSLAPQRRAELLVHAMTLDEKILEIHMTNTKEHPREVPAVERLGIPALKITNAPWARSGRRSNPEPATAFPSALALAASWVPPLAEQFGCVPAVEAADRGEHVIEAPGANIARVPQNGAISDISARILISPLGWELQETQGFQSPRVMAEVKHSVVRGVIPSLSVIPRAICRSGGQSTLDR